MLSNDAPSPETGVKVYVDITPVAVAVVFERVLEYPVIAPPKTRWHVVSATKKR